MGKLIYSMMISLDGYISDTRGDFDWVRSMRKCISMRMKKHAVQVSTSTADECTKQWFIGRPPQSGPNPRPSSESSPRFGAAQTRLLYPKRSPSLQAAKLGSSLT
jgi:hypothetical protein